MGIQWYAEAFNWQAKHSMRDTSVKEESVFFAKWCNLHYLLTPFFQALDLKASILSSHML